MKTTESINLLELQKELSLLSMQALRERFARYYDHTPKTRNKAHFVAKILWAVQRDAFGDISDQSRKKALQIADDRDLRERFPKVPSGKAPNDGETVSVAFKPTFQLTPGTQLRRNYKGREIQVLVLENGFEWDSRWFKSLSAIAREATGTQWNGKLFFKVKGAA